MAGKSTISIGFKVEDADGGFKNLIVDATQFKKLMESNVTQAEKLRKSLVNFATLTTGIDSVSNSLNTMLSMVKNLSSAYAVQQQAETRLEQVMRNTMGARDEDIQSIKDYCSAQQRIGVIGDEVQLAGAQELATYLELKSSLKSMIPVMNDMLAQQYGLNATSENAAQIATMLGKVMQGQTGALSRYGYKFDEAQEKILKYGTESERVATLVQVISESVGGMNQKLAQTDSGKMKQLENTIGDIKEQLGSLAVKVEPILTVGANATIAVGGVLKLIQALKTLKASLMAVQVSAGVVGIALAAIGYAVYYITQDMQEASKAMDEFSTAEGRAARASRDMAEVTQAEEEALKGAKSKMELYISKTKEFKGSKTEEKKLVKELNEAYGETMGYFRSVSEWYNALIKNSKAYCDQIVAEAKARKLADQIAEKEIERSKIFHNDDGSMKELSGDPEMNFFASMGSLSIGQGLVFDKSELDKAWDKYNTLTQEIEYLRKQASTVSSNKVQMPVMGSSYKPDLEGNDKKEKTRLEQINAEIKKQTDLYAKSSESGRISITEKIDSLKAEKAAIEAIYAELERPMSFGSLDDYDKELSYLNKARTKASQEELKEIDERIAALDKERQAFSVAGNMKLETEEDYSKVLSYVTRLISNATGEELKELNVLKNGLEESHRAFQRANHETIDPEKITSYRKLEEEIAYYTALLQEGNEDERKFAADNLPLLKKKQKEWEKMIATLGEVRPTIYFEEPDLEQGSIEDKRQSLQNANNQVDQIKSDLANKIIDKHEAQKQIEDINSMLQKLHLDPLKIEITDDGKLLTLDEQTKKTQNDLEKAKDAVGNFGQALSNLAGDNEALAKSAYIAQAIGQLVLSFASSMKGNITPWDWIAAAVAGTATLTSIIGQFHTFADGGIISGPTLGLMGEYAGASNNPEVVAPLSDLKSMLGETSSDWSGRVVFKIDGKVIKGVLERVDRFDSRTR